MRSRWLVREGCTVRLVADSWPGIEACDLYGDQASAACTVHREKVGAVLTSEALNGRPGLIRWKYEEIRRSSELVLPVAELFVQHRAFHPFPLPQRIVGVLNGQRRQERSGFGLRFSF